MVTTSLKRAAANLRRKGAFLRGYLGDGTGVVEVADRPGYYYVRVDRPGGYEVGIFPGRVRPYDNLPVRIERHPLTGVQYIAGTDDEVLAYSGVDPTTVPTAEPHAASHEWTSTAGDQLQWLNSLQIYPLRCQPSTTAQTVVIQGGEYRIEGVTYRHDDPWTVALSSYYPTTGSKWVLLYLTSSQTVGVVDNGSVSPETDNAPAHTYPVAAVRLRATIANVNWIQDIKDRRWAVPGSPLGTTVNPFEYLAFEDSPSSVPTGEGVVSWNEDAHTLDVQTGLGPVLQVGQELYVLGYNDTGAEIANGSAVYPVGAVGGVPSFALANAETHVKILGVVLVATMDIPDESIGIFTQLGKVSDVDTSAWSLGDTLWVSAATDGDLTNVRPEFPNYVVQVGGVTAVSATDGSLQIDVRGAPIDTIENTWNGTIRESFDFRVTESGGTVTGTLTSAGGQTYLTLMFTDGFSVIASGGTVTLTPGTDTNPQTNYVYIPKSTKSLTVSTSSWPTTEHARVAEIVLHSATSTGSYGALRNQNINDHIQGGDGVGHLLHIGQRIRTLDAAWDSGTEATLSGTTTNVYIDVTAGVVWQMHPQSFPALAMSTGDVVNVVNDDTTAYRATSNLNDITDDAEGNSLNNRWFSIVIWGVANKTGEASRLMCNLPLGGYLQESAAVEDADNYAVYTIPRQFRGVGFLIARFVIRKSGTSFTYNSSTGYQDLRGYVPNTSAGGGGGGAGVTTFLGLTDTPSVYTGYGGYAVVVNAAETAVEFADLPGSYLKLDASNGPVTGDLLVKLGTDSATAFQVQQSDSTEVFAVDTVNSRVSGRNLRVLNDGTATSTNSDVDFLATQDELNIAKSALYIASSDPTNSRIYLGTSSSPFFSLNLTHVTRLESVPSFVTTDNLAHGYVASGSFVIGRTGVDYAFVASAPGANFKWYTGSSYGGITGGATEKMQLNVGGSLILNNAGGVAGGVTPLMVKASTDHAATDAITEWQSSTGNGLLSVLACGAVEHQEVTAPGAGAANSIRLYGEDDSGTTVWRAIFSGGHVTTIAKDGGFGTYTQIYSTADRTLSAYTADDESVAYAGIDNTQTGSVYAQLADLNALRTAYENLRAFAEDLAQFVNAEIDDFQAAGVLA